MDISAISALTGSGNTAALAALQKASLSPQGATATSATAAQTRKAAAQFEAILVRQMLSKSVGSMLGGTGHTAGLMYGDLMTDVLAQQLTAGGGLGLGKMLARQLSPAASATKQPAPAKPTS